MRKILITEKQKKHLKKAIAAQDQVGGKVRVLSPGMVCEDNGEVITLYHGVMAKNLEFNIENGGFIPRVCSEGGPSAVWLSQKMYGYQFIFKFDIPVDQVSQMTNVDYIYTDAIPFDSFNCELVKTNILVDYDGLCAEVNLLNRNLLSNQLRILPDLIGKLREMFSSYPGVYEKFVKPYLPGGTLSESVNSEIETWYRGYNPKFGLYGADTPYMLWLTTDLEYAKEYAKHFNGAVMEFQIDMSRCNGCVYDLPEDVDYYDGPDQETANELLADGINSYCFWANQDQSYCMCLWSTEPIVSQRQLPMNEDVDSEKYQIGFEPGGFEPNGHIINETNDRFNGESFSKNAGTITFITFQENPMVVYYSNERGMTHIRLTQRLMKTGAIPTYDFNDKVTIRADLQQTGRYWVGQNTISFWSTPALAADRSKLSNVVRQLGLDKNTLDIDFWDTKKVMNVNSQFVLPYKWFFNGTFDDLMEMGAYSITKRSDNAYFVMYGDFKHALLDKEGNVVNNTLNEDREWCEQFDYKPYLRSIADFLVEKGIGVKPYPRVILHHKEQEGLYIKTGYYDPDKKEVHLFICDRHPKDVLRSFTHEMIHHSQNLRGILVGYKGDTLDGDEVLDKLESEAYLKGNIYFRKWTEELHPEIPNKKQKLNENIEEIFDIDELSTPDSIDLSSFDIKDQLNPRFWKDNRLDSRVRIALLDIADDFIDSLDVNWVEPKDIIVTGSLANFNWSKKHSDVDLHIVMDFSEVDTNVKLVKDYFDSKRRIWNDTHENLNIAGYPVELYVQDEHEPHASSGVYSLERDEWLVEPSHDDMEIEYDEDVVRKKVSDYMNEIDELEEEYEDSVADCDLSELHDKVIDVFRRIKAERKNGFDNGGGEYNTGNIIFKALRRNGYIAKVDKLKTDTYDSMMSLLNENAFDNQK